MTPGRCAARSCSQGRGHDSPGRPGWPAQLALHSGASVATAALAARCRIGQTGAVLHIAKLAVGTRDLDQLAAHPPLRHRTRNFPRRAAEVLEGGSLYWVIAGSMLARQRLLDIVDAHWDDGTKCAALMLDAALVPLVGRPSKPFQGWRYLAAADAPADLRQGDAAQGAEALPAGLRRELQALCLL